MDNFQFDEENVDREVIKRETVKKDRSVIYMGVILGSLIMVMAYITLFIDDPSSLFHKDEKKTVLTLVGDQSNLLNKTEAMDNTELRDSLVRFIEAFYYDQRKGYFDPPSYFAPITLTFYNYHNLTYEGLKDLYWKRMADMKKLQRSWDVSSLEFARTDSGIVAGYWTRESYFKPSLSQQQSSEIRYEIIIDHNGKIISLKAVEVRNFQAFSISGDTSVHPVPVNAGAVKPPASNIVKDQKTYDVSLVDIIPQYPGGPALLAKFLQTNLHYPALAKEKKIHGNVYISFFVEKDGTMSNIEVKQGLGSGCDEEALRLVRSLPLWSPGMINGNAVTTYYVLPIPFQLN